MSFKSDQQSLKDDSYIKFQKLQMSYDILQSQYNDLKRQYEVSQHSEKEISKYLYELELSLSQHYNERKNVTLKEYNNKSARDRVENIVNLINDQNLDNVELIKKLKERLEETTNELEIAWGNINQLQEVNTELRKRQFASVSEKGETEIDVALDGMHQKENTVPQVVVEKKARQQNSFEQSLSNVMDEDAESKPSPVITEDVEKKSLTELSKRKALAKEYRADMLRVADEFLEENQKNPLSKLQWVLIFIMGSEGISERSEIEQYIGKNMELDASTASISNALNQLEALNVIDKERIATGRRNNFFVHSLTKLGVGLYLKNFSGKYPFVHSEKKKITEMHDNALHGYFIKDCKLTLYEMGYINICDDRKANTIDVFNDNKNVWIPDIIAYTPTGEKEYFECELGNHTQMDFNVKLYKATRETNVLKFIVRDKDAQKSCENLIRNWHSNSSSSHTHVEMTIYIITLNNLFVRKTFGEPFQIVTM